MTANKERPLTSFNDSMQSQLCCGRICLPTIFKVTRRLISKPQFKRREERNIEANFPLPDWLAKFTEFMQATGQPLSAAHSQDESLSYVMHDEWQKAEPIYRRWPNLKTIPLNSEGDTALHLAVRFSRTSFFKGLMDLLAPEELAVTNEHRNTAFFICASLGNVKFARTMLGKNPGLAMIKGKHRESSVFPIHVAAFYGNRQMLQLLCPATILDDLGAEQISVLFFMTLKNNIFDVAYALLVQFPILAASRNEDHFTPLHVLARKLQEEFYEATGSCYWGYLLIDRLWTAAKFMSRHETWDLMTRPSYILFDAAKSGNIKILDLVFQSRPELFLRKDYKKRNLFHFAVLSREENLLFHLIEKRIFADHLMLETDRKGNNILHLAGMLPPIERFGSLQPHIQMQRELSWFKEVENRVPTVLKTMRNLEGLTPKDVFNREHANKFVEAGVAAKDAANYSMLVATIIATIVFAASLTVPGHDVSPTADSSILQKKGWYIMFILFNSIALFSSSSSIILFLSVLTSSIKDEEFISLSKVRLIIGGTTLFVATTSMVVAFTAACFLIFNHLSTWVAYLVASLGFTTVPSFVFLLFGDLIRPLCWSVKYKLSRWL